MVSMVDQMVDQNASFPNPGLRGPPDDDKMKINKL